MERNGPRKTAVFSGSVLLLPVMAGAIGLSMGSELGYFAPVGALVKWFPDERVSEAGSKRGQCPNLDLRGVRIAGPLLLSGSSALQGRIQFLESYCIQVCR